MRALMACVAFGTLAALSGCGQKTDGQPASAGGEAAKVAPAAPAAPEPVSWPKRKPGLWTQTMNLKEQGFSRSFRFCIDAATDEKIGVSAQNMGDQCQQKSMTRDPGGGYTVVSSCDMGPSGKTESTIHASGDFNTRYAVDITSTTTGAAQAAMNGEHKMSMTAEWSGPCPAGWAAGDVEMPGGRRMNMLTKTMSGG